MTQELAKVPDKSVGVIFFLRAEDGSVSAKLLRRGRHEQAGDRYREESYRDLCQATMHVKMRPEEANSGDEGVKQAVERGIKKELGIALYFELKKQDQLKNLKLLFKLENENKIVLTFGLVVPAKLFTKFVHSPVGTKKI